MTKQQQTNSQPTTTEAGRRAELRVYAVTEGKNGGKSFWQDIGAAWAHRSGEGFNVVLNFLPLQGQKIVMRANEPKDDE